MADYDFTYTGAEIQAILDTGKKLKDSGYIFLGVATPSTNPGTPTQKVYYEAKQAGTYTNFGGVVLPDGMSLLIWNGSWTSETVMSGDGGVFDISVYKSTGGTLAKYTDLAAALGTNGANIPQSLRKGGMSVKFVQSSDNKYVQYRLIHHEFTTEVTLWQGVDTNPVAGSINLAMSGSLSGVISDYSQKLFGEKVTIIDYYVNINDGATIQDSSNKRGIILKVTPQNSYIIKGFGDIAGSVCCAFSQYPRLGGNPQLNGYLGNISVTGQNPFKITYNDCRYIMFTVYTSDNNAATFENELSVFSIRNEVAANNFYPIPYVKEIRDKYINLSGALVDNYGGRSIQVFAVNKGDIVKIDGVCAGSVVCSWALFEDINLTTPLYLGVKATVFSPLVYQCTQDGYIAVCSITGNGSNISWQTMYVSKMIETKNIAEKVMPLSGPFEQDGEISITWVDGHYIDWTNGVIQDNQNYCYTLIDATIDTDAIRIQSATWGGYSMCRIGYIDRKGAYHLLKRGDQKGDSTILVDLKPSEYEMRFLILSTQIAQKSGNHIYKLKRVLNEKVLGNEPTIICEGDSLVEWSSPYSVSTAITSQLGIATLNVATGGENSLCVTARDGAIPMFLTGLNKSALTIGGSTNRIEVEIWDEFCKQRLALRTTSSNISLRKLYINNLAFTLTIEGNVPIDDGSGNEPDFSDVHYYITPDSNYESQTFSTPIRVVTYAAKNFREFMPLVQFGSNDAIYISNYQERAPKVVARHKAIIKYHNTENFFVLGMYPVGLRDLDANKWIQKMYWEEFGYRFIDIRQYLVDYGLQLLNITPTKGDLEDIAVGVVPRSLRLSGITHHLTDSAQVLMCNYVVERVKYFIENS